MKVLFLGETYRADAQTWIKGLKLYANAEVQTWELPSKAKTANYKRIWIWVKAVLFLRKKVKEFNPDIILAYRTTSYGFIAAKLGFRPIVVAQQGITDIWPPDSAITPIKRYLRKTALDKADIVHAWGPIMVPSIKEMNVPDEKLIVRPKGVDNRYFYYKAEDKHWNSGITAIVTRSLFPDYRHTTILKAIKLLKDRNIPVHFTMIGDGVLMDNLLHETKELGIEAEVGWEGRIENEKLPEYLRKCNTYVSMPITEGVSSSLFEAMACGCFPVVTDIPGNRSWIKDGENGFLVTKDDPEMLADKMEQAYIDQQLVAKAVEQNRLLIEEEATFQKNMPYFISRYRELIEKYRGK